jgi:hypothetical protein
MQISRHAGREAIGNDAITASAREPRLPASGIATISIAEMITLAM